MSTFLTDSVNDIMLEFFRIESSLNIDYKMREMGWLIMDNLSNV